MHMILPGYPKTNPILKGVASLHAGIPLEEVLEERERTLPTPIHFAQACLEAIGWLPPDSPLVEGLIAQSSQAFRQLGSLDQHALLEHAEKNVLKGGNHAAALLGEWREVATP